MSLNISQTSPKDKEALSLTDKNSSQKSRIRTHSRPESLVTKNELFWRLLDLKKKEVMIGFLGWRKSQRKGSVQPAVLLCICQEEEGLITANLLFGSTKIQDVVTPDQNFT